MFHRHQFKQSSLDLETIFCECGEIKSLHQHEWEEVGPILERGIKLGSVLRCKKCGERKTFTTN